jgi:hypothetical protein
MKAKIITTSVIFAALLLPLGAAAQTNGSGPNGATVGAGTGTVGGSGSGNMNGSDELRGLIQQFREQRHEILQARQQLAERLRTCTEAEREAIMEQFRLEQRERLQQERELRRQVKEQTMEIRRQRRMAGQSSG